MTDDSALRHFAPVLHFHGPAALRTRAADIVRTPSAATRSGRRRGALGGRGDQVAGVGAGTIANRAAGGPTDTVPSFIATPGREARLIGRS